MLKQVNSSSRTLKRSKQKEDMHLSSGLLKKPFPKSDAIWKKLDDYQRLGVEFALDVKTVALFFEQGTGKTLLTLGLLEKLLDHNFSALVIAPLSNVESTWADTIRAEMPQVFLCRTLASFKSAPMPKILLLHYEALPKIITKVRRIKFTAIVYDESQRLKQRSTLTARTAHKLRKVGEYRIALSGTPIDSTPADVWSQFKFINEDVLGDAWKYFEEDYFEPLDEEAVENAKKKLRATRYGSIERSLALRKFRILTHQRGFDFDKLDNLVDEISPYSMRITKQVLKLPPLNIVYRESVMRGKQRRLYDQLRDHFVSTLPTITTPLKITQLAKLTQITGGFVYDDEDELNLVGYAKLRQLLHILDERKPPLVIFARYRAEVEAIATLCGNEGSVGMLTGKTPKKDRPGIIRSFQRGEIDYLVCQQRTGGVGIDLFASNVMVFYSVGFSFIDFEQALARTHRRGQLREVTAYMLVTKDSVDKDVCDALVKKRKIANSVLVKLTNSKRKKYLLAA